MEVDLMVLQERCRKDPLSYHEEFLSQRRHFDALLESATMRPSEPSPHLAEVAAFMGSVAHCYGKDGESIAPTIATFLSESGPTMDPDLRRSLVRLLGLLRARDAADATVIIPLFFRLLACQDKQLRRMLHGHIVSDIKKIQTSGHSSRRALQTFLFSMVEDPSEVLVKRSLHVLVDLFRKKIWNDAKCANMIGKACFHQATPVAIIATKFILDSESKEEDEESDEEEDEEVVDQSRKTRDGQRAADLWKSFNMTGKKSSKKRKRMERIINRMTRIKSCATSTAITETNSSHPALEAMMLINDPQDFAERLFSDLQTKRKKESYENRLIFINLISRLVGTHQLILFNLYPFLQRYLQPAQPEVTKVLAYLTQACHDMVPSDVLHPILRGLADSFVSERSSPPSMAAGINTIRAICSRVPLAILDEENEMKSQAEQESPLLEDLVQYKSDKDKGVMMAARSLIALYREVHPGLLQKKDRGRAGAEAVQNGQTAQARAYGQHMYATGVEGVELLNKKDSDEEEDDEIESDDDADLSEEEPQLEPIPKQSEKKKDNEKYIKTNFAKDNATNEIEETCDKVDVDENDNSEDEGEDEDDDHDTGNESDSKTEDDDKNNTDEKQKPRLDELEILSNEDFAKIRARRAAESLGKSSLVKQTGEAVDPDELQGPIKRERRTLAERMESVIEGREGREKFGSKKGSGKGGGSTNKKKLKKKSNSMVIHKRRNKSKQLSRRDKQMSKRKKHDYK